MKCFFYGTSRTSSDITDREGGSLAQRHLELINDIEIAIAGRRMRFGTYVAELKGYLQQKGVDEQF